MVGSDEQNERGEAMTKTQGFGAAQHAGREFRVGGVVQVTAEDSMRQGQLGLVTEIRSSSYAVVAIHSDGQERAWTPDELAVVAAPAAVLEELREVALTAMNAGRTVLL